MEEEGLKNACSHYQRKPWMYKLNKPTLEEGAVFQENTLFYMWHLRLSSPSAMFYSSWF